MKRSIQVMALFSSAALQAQTEAPSEPPVLAEAVAPRISLGLGLTTGGKASWDDLSASSGPLNVDGEAELEFGNSAAIGIDCKLNFVPHSWGFGFGAWYDFKRRSDGGSVTLGNQKSTIGSSDPSNAATFSQLVVYGNAIYRWDAVYFNAGFNLNAVRFKMPSTFQGTYEAKGGLGAQIGVGSYVSDQLAIELNVESTALKLAEHFNGVDVDFGNGYVGTLYLGGRYDIY